MCVCVCVCVRPTDLVAIPDFLAGAMENWGVITFRETSLLVRNQSSPLDKQLVASVIAHELAHQVGGVCAECVCTMCVYDVCVCVCEIGRASCRERV